MNSFDPLFCCWTRQARPNVSQSKIFSIIKKAFSFQYFTFDLGYGITLDSVDETRTSRLLYSFSKFSLNTCSVAAVVLLEKISFRMHVPIRGVIEAYLTLAFSSYGKQAVHILSKWSRILPISLSSSHKFWQMSTMSLFFSFWKIKLNLASNNLCLNFNFF